MARFFDNPERLDRVARAGEAAAKAYEDENRGQSAQSASLLTVRACDMGVMGYVAALAKEIALRTLELTDGLDKRIEELERAPFAYDGPHETGKVYDKGLFVTHDGSLWHCNYKTASRPGDGPAWTLAVKRGKDAR